MLFGALIYSEDIYPEPGVVPAFLVSPDSGWVYFLTFLSPAILYGLVLSAVAWTSIEAKFAGLRHALLSFAGVIAIPTPLYLFFLFSTGARRGGLDAIFEIALIWAR